ncbi:MAG: dTDP-4-dehydrorhamnose reductase [Acidobacteriaceae bacterium]
MSGAPRVLILGAAGQVGRELQRSFAGMGKVVALDRARANLAEPESLREVVRGVGPDVILNAAAYTAVDRAEQEWELAFAVNAVAPRLLAEEARRQGALLVHYSTDYVFDGSKAGPWVESDTTGPLNVYGASKLAGEQAIADTGGRYLIFRTSWVYGPEGKNFLLTMLRLGRERDRLRVVDDQFGAPTSSMEIADATRGVVEKALRGGFDGVAGVYHMSCAGSTTWCGFARSIFERGADLLGGKRPELEAIATAEYPTPARRPVNSVLSNEALNERFGVRLAGWEAGLERVLEALRSLEATGGQP